MAKVYKCDACGVMMDDPYWMRMMVRNISIAEAVEACNALSSFYKIEGIYGNLEEVWHA